MKWIYIYINSVHSTSDSMISVTLVCLIIVPLGNKSTTLPNFRKLIRLPPVIRVPPGINFKKPNKSTTPNNSTPRLDTLVFLIEWLLVLDLVSVIVHPENFPKKN